MRNEPDADRRSFLQKTAAAGGALAVTAAAGCLGDDGDDDAPGAEGEQVEEFLYLNNPQDYSPQRHDAINFIGERLEEIGLEVDVEVMEWGSLFDTVTQQQEYDFATWWTFFFAEIGDGLLEHFYSEGGSNYYNYENDELDEQIQAQMATPDQDERVELIHDIQRTLMDDVPKMPLAHMEAPNLYDSTVIQNWEPHIRGFNSYFNMVNLEVEGTDTISAAWPEGMGHLNVYAWGGESKLRYQFNMLFDRLIHVDGDYEIDLDLGLATDYELPDDETVIYEIRDHSFHDGEPVTAEDVAFSFNYVVENEIPAFIDQTAYIDEAEVVDDETVRINLSQPLGPVHLFLGHEIPIVPKHVWEGIDDPVQQETTDDIVIGSGPMEFDYWDEGSEVGLTRYDDHFQGVDFENRYWRIIPETSTVFQLLEDGELTYEPFGRVARQTQELLDEDNHLEAAQQLSSDFWHFSMNTDSVSDVQLRKAIVETLPRTAIVDQFIFGFAQRGFNVVSPAFGDFHTDDVTDYEESIEAARDRLADAGYGWDDDGMLHYPE